MFNLERRDSHELGYSQSSVWVSGSLFQKTVSVNPQPAMLSGWVLSHHLENHFVFLFLTGSEHHSFIWSNKIHCLQHLWKSTKAKVRGKGRLQRNSESWEKDWLRFDFTDFEFCHPRKTKSQPWGVFSSRKGRLVRVRVKLNVEKCNNTHRDKVFTHAGPPNGLKLLIPTRKWAWARLKVI